VEQNGTCPTNRMREPLNKQCTYDINEISFSGNYTERLQSLKPVAPTVFLSLQTFLSFCYVCLFRDAKVLFALAKLRQAVHNPGLSKEPGTLPWVCLS